MPGQAMCKKQNLSLEGLQESRDISDVLEYLYLGGSSSVLDCKDLAEKRVTHIINCTKGAPHDPTRQPEYNFVHLRLQVDDEPDADITSSFEPSFSMIRAARNGGGAALVHCKKGMSRSATIVMGYCMAYEKMRAVDALRYLQCKRPLVSPNIGFMSQLLVLEKSLYGMNTIDLEKYKKDRFAAADSLKICGTFPLINIILSPRSPTFLYNRQKSNSDKSETEIGWLEPSRRRTHKQNIPHILSLSLDDHPSDTHTDEHSESKQSTFKKGLRRLRSLPGLKWAQAKMPKNSRMRAGNRTQTLSPSEHTSPS